MEINALAEGLMDALENFDRDILPLGLYASDDLVQGKYSKPRYQEWNGTIFPYLASQGCQVGEFYHYPEDSCTSRGHCCLPQGERVRIILVKFSNVKVLKFGSGYHVDQHAKREQRWMKVDLKDKIRRLWNKSGSHGPDAGILLFVGFDKTQRPFEHKLNQLQEELKWQEKNVSYFTRGWQDRANRGFGVRLCAWAHSFVS